VECVRWARARAARDRAREEKEILGEEFKRTIRSFERMSFTWQQLAQRNDKGRAAYAHQQAVMFNALADDCRNKVSANQNYSKYLLMLL
jgi:hypothetical protein